MIDRIKKHEGFSPTVYKDTLGYDTIGYGFHISYLKLSKEVSDIILDQKIKAIKSEISNKISYFNLMPDIVQEVLIEMVYQLGMSAVLNFKKSLQFLKQGKWLEFSDEILRSRWAELQTPKRAKDLSNLIKRSI